MTHFPLELAITDGSHRLSRVSISRNTTSWSSMRPSSRTTSARTDAADSSDTAWPGIGMDMLTPSESIPGKIFFKCSAAALALGLPPARQSSNSNKDWRAGFENETAPLSTKVIFRTPHPMRQRATLHPRVPAPRSRHRVPAMRSRSSEGRRRQRMSCRFSVTAVSASLAGSIVALKSTIRGPNLSRTFFSQPTILGRTDMLPSGSPSVCTMLLELSNAPSLRAPLKQTTRRVGPGRCVPWARAATSRLRRGHPGLLGSGQGSANPRSISLASPDACHSAHCASGPTATPPSPPMRMTKWLPPSPRAVCPALIASLCFSENASARGWEAWHVTPSSTSAGNANQ
eukprot:Opistho-2@48149